MTRLIFAAYVKTGGPPQNQPIGLVAAGRWGYLLIWATLGVACATAASCSPFPFSGGWRTIFLEIARQNSSPSFIRLSRRRLYHGCEVGLIAHFVMALGQSDHSASVLITGMLVFSGLGALLSERVLPRMRTIMPVLFIAIGGLLIGYAFFLNNALDAIGDFPYGCVCCFFAIIAPPAFLMGSLCRPR